MGESWLIDQMLPIIEPTKLLLKCCSTIIVAVQGRGVDRWQLGIGPREASTKGFQHQARAAHIESGEVIDRMLLGIKSVETFDRVCGC
ncbi:hypothetical protein NDU88_007661 [Pleurodeles waltl]|uniref:Uncharacterized protein n=1 Tax=Pleurodeles waltl TaxID=8319 RepID=A0AAV7QSJ0_PLEWA|nr:hypothetical protein NDU88_007661 [Pleurodeles waltl]